MIEPGKQVDFLLCTAGADGWTKNRHRLSDSPIKSGITCKAKSIRNLSTLFKQEITCGYESNEIMASIKMLAFYSEHVRMMPDYPSFASLLALCFVYASLL